MSPQGAASEEKRCSPDSLQCEPFRLKVEGDVNVETMLVPDATDCVVFSATFGYWSGTVEM